ncbi:hypothetical protein BU24DRAFT_417224 [Aaosphaeria arxii CBS 175.79]|uniref:Exosome complex protein n=1 Tax=Aaosphaeria arxii CBS 175.79 TaxID=1450172 RepID=A0A6A5Y7P6_9PLEO|nr:uncharacterized protein BU24DRAFT_417224 [Aaosphaeria arxii CBS 175.79]KAF2021592.1 hypothetical protein BU24DRAFT_417224 [Aaosphaeria arxii CBS 175.79]
MDINDQIEDLEANIDELSEALIPLLNNPLATTISTLPLLDKAKLYVLLSYSIESLLFSTLQISGENAREHAVFAELARLKGYFQKIKDAELGSEPKTRLDKGAAARFIKHGLAGNDRYDKERAERIAKEKAKVALMKAKGKHTKFEDAAENRVNDTIEVKGRGLDQSSSGLVSETTDHPSEEPAGTSPGMPKRASATGINDSSPQNDAGFTPYVSKSAKKQEAKEARKVGRTAEKKARQAQRREKKQQQRLERARGGGAGGQGEEQIIPERGHAPKSHSEAFNALLDGTFKGKATSKGKKARKS